MKKLKINHGCISCGACEFIAPEVFEVTDISRVKQDADIKKNDKKIIEAKRSCPVGVIHYEDESGDGY